jgi:hypothetical protein
LKIPLDLRRNAAWRLRALSAGRSSAADAAALRRHCSSDPVEWFNGFACTYDPRLAAPTVPFILYPFQTSAVREIDAAIGSHDLCIQKSRDMGASWLLLGTFLWRWLFRPDQTFLLVSRNEDYVDRAGNPKSLFWKLDFYLRHLPSWMVPRFERVRLRLTNLDNGSTIDGESTTGDVARGDRRTAIALDEFAAFETDSGYRAMASTRDATRSRIFNSTPSGTGNAFADVARSAAIRQLRLHWSDHPVKAEGLYWSDGAARSPWYDRECQRCVSPTEIAQELDISFSGSQSLFFDPSRLAEIRRRCVDPEARGEIEHSPDGSDPEWVASKGGRWKLWCGLSLDGYPPPSDYSVGADVASGTGSSNSCLSVLDLRTGRKVAEWAASDVRPDQMAAIAVAACKWFRESPGRPAMLIHEAAGPGRIMGDVAIEAGFRNFWMRPLEGMAVRKYSQRIGWFPTKDGKTALWGNYRRLLFEGAMSNPSIDAVNECAEMVYTGGGVEHVRSIASQDASGARANHGDRATADALAALAMSARAAPSRPSGEDAPPTGTIACRRAAAAAATGEIAW